MEKQCVTSSVDPMIQLLVETHLAAITWSNQSFSVWRCQSLTSLAHNCLQRCISLL